MKRRRIGLSIGILFFVWIAASCNKPASVTGKAITGKLSLQSRTQTAKKLLHYVPRDAFFVSSLSLSQPLAKYVDHMSLFSDNNKHFLAMIDELDSYTKQKKKVDLLRASSLVIYAMPPVDGKEPQVGIMVAPVTNFGTDAAFHLGEDMWAISKNNILFIGENTYLANIATSKQSHFLEGNQQNTVTLLPQRNSSLRAIAYLDVLRSEMPEIPPGLDYGTLLIDQDVATLALHGRKPVLENLQAIYKNGSGEALSVLGSKKNEATASDNWGQAIAMIWAYYSLLSTTEDISPKLKSDTQLVVSLPMKNSDAIASATTVGILSAIAVPAFMRYMAQARAASEASKSADIVPSTP